MAMGATWKRATTPAGAVNGAGAGLRVRTVGRASAGYTSLALLLFACGDGGNPPHQGKIKDSGVAHHDGGHPPDAGTTTPPSDAGQRDAGDDMDASVETMDAALKDAGPFDAGPIEAGPSDAGPHDAGPHDAGIVTFRYVYEHLIGTRCAYCHHPDSDGDGGADWAMIGWSLGHLDMHSVDAAYDNLVGPNDAGVQAAGVHCSPAASGEDYRRVIPGDPDNSLIIHKVSEATPVCGVRMPDDNSGPLDDASIELIHDWIEDGAKW
ncbi:MAG: hypothetical protein QM778_14520 [Myxococcales bacterium]